MEKVHLSAPSRSKKRRALANLGQGSISRLRKVTNLKLRLSLSHFSNERNWNKHR